MHITPTIKRNIAFTAHPLGIQEYVKSQIEELEQLPKFAGPKAALIIGGSTGYGLATRLALGINSGTKTVNVSYETVPTDKRTGSAGFWNNIYANKFLTEAGIDTADFLGDAFSDETKKVVADYIREHYGKIDLLVYSLASGRRQDPKTGIVHSSALKVIGDEPLTGYFFDLNTQVLSESSVTPATDEEIANTVKVMGGEDWQLWVEYLLEHDLLADNFQTVAYSYIGPNATKRIYREGTIGKAKEHLEATARHLDGELAETIHGKAYTAVCKAAMTRASAVIPIVPIYAAALMKVMEEKGIEELPHKHIYRLLTDMMYGDKPEIDADGRYRPDMWELRPDVQAEVEAVMDTITPENVQDYVETDRFVKIFMEQNGFGFANIDYDQDVDINTLLENNPIIVL